MRNVFGFVLLAISLAPATVFAGTIAPVSLGFDYQAEAEILNVHAEINAPVAFGTDGSDLDIAINAQALAMAIGEADGEVEPQTPEDPPMIIHGSVLMDASMGASQDVSGAWEISSNFHLEAQGADWGSGSAEARLDGTLQVGISETFIAGSAGLTLNVNAIGFGGGYWDALGWSLRLSSTDSGNPFDVTMSYSNRTADIALLAGQSVAVDFDQAAIRLGINGWDSIPDGGVDVSINITPEPATMGLLILGGLGLLRKKRR